MTSVEIDRKKLRDGLVGVWFEVTDRHTFYNGDTDDFIEIRLYPHAKQWEHFRIEFQYKGRSVTEYEATGYYLSGPGYVDDPRFLGRRKDDAMREAEVLVAVMLTGGSLSDIRRGEPRTVTVACSGCGQLREQRR